MNVHRRKKLYSQVKNLGAVGQWGERFKRVFPRLSKAYCQKMRTRDLVVQACRLTPWGKMRQSYWKSLFLRWRCSNLFQTEMVIKLLVRHFGWDFMKENVMGVFKEFQEHDRFVKSMNSLFLVLILKGGANDLKYFQSISLVGTIYKFLATFYQASLKKVISKVVSSFQNAFVEGRQILDS